MNGNEALVLSDVRRSFGRTVALDGASCSVRHGTIHALLGENGAGKTTLMRIAFGLLKADGGDIRVRGARVALHSSRDAIALGVGMVHQHFMLVPAMTVAENVALGSRGRFDREATAARVDAIGRDSGLVLDPTEIDRKRCHRGASRTARPWSRDRRLHRRRACEAVNLVK